MITNVKHMGSKTFSEQLLEYKLGLFKFALALTRDKVKANDLLQETFLNALNYKKKFRYGSSVKPWVFTIMRNLYRNDYRKMQKNIINNNLSNNDFFMVLVKDNQPIKPDEEFIVKEILKEINNLSIKMKKPFKMFISGYKYEEISSILSVKVGTIKSRIFMARGILREKLKDFEYKNQF